uniref:Uncharacterized protein n=1 Tax=Macrostomum lignano TaxID=282301 RepID=A0A1I8JPV3_9PLAT
MRTKNSARWQQPVAKVFIWRRQSEAGDVSVPATASMATSSTAATSPTPVKKSDRLAKKRLLGGPLTGPGRSLSCHGPPISRPAKRARTSNSWQSCQSQCQPRFPPPKRWLVPTNLLT